MFGRNRIRGLMAQAIYEELEPVERKELDRALDRSPKLRTEAEALGLLSERIPSEEVTLDRDLGPSIMAQLQDPLPQSNPRTLHLVTSIAALGLVLSGVLYMIIAKPPIAQAPQIAEAPTALQEDASALQVMIARAESMMRGRNFSKAYVTLAESLDAVEADPLSGAARQLMADLAYEELQWYPEAYANYNALRLNDNEEFQLQPDNLMRLNLLDESRVRDINYSSLHALDAARLHESFEDMEGVLARYPTTYVASLAAEEMARLSLDREDANSSSNWRLAGMEAALGNVSDPVARDQLKIEIGHLAYRELNDPDRARALYEEVAQGGHTLLADLARSSLEGLKAPR